MCANPNSSSNAIATESVSAKEASATVAHQNGERLNRTPHTTATSTPKQQTTKVVHMIDIADCRKVNSQTAAMPKLYVDY